MHRLPENSGWIEVICGSMFSGKTQELISRLRRELYAKRKIQVFKPETDNRYACEAVVTHDAGRLECVAVSKAEELLGLLEEDTSVVGIDECQFFGTELISTVEEMANRGLRVICAGLDQDYLGRPFEPIPQLMAVAEFVTKKLAVCMVCGNPANRSQRMDSEERKVLIGAKGIYQARCRRCHSPNAVAPEPQRMPNHPGRSIQPINPGVLTSGESFNNTRI